MSTVIAPTFALSEETTRTLQTALEQLLAGDLQLWQLPTAITDIFNTGWGMGNAEAKAAAGAQAERYERDLDRLYLAAFTPAERRQELLARHDALYQPSN